MSETTDELLEQAEGLRAWWDGFYHRGGVLSLTDYRLMQPADLIVSAEAFERFSTARACLIAAALADLPGVFSTLDGGAARTQAHLEHVARQEAQRLSGAEEDDGA